MANMEQVAASEQEKLGATWFSVSGPEFLAMLQSNQARVSGYENAVLLEVDCPGIGVGVWELAHASEAARFLRPS